MRLQRSRIITILSFIFIFSTVVTAPSKAAGLPGLTMYVKYENTNTLDTPIQEFYSGVCWQGGIDNVNFTWGDGGQGACPTDFFTDFITGYIKAPATGNIYFYNISDDGFYLKINDIEVINDWEEQGVNNPNGQGSFYMNAGNVYSIKIWHHETGGGAWNQLFWNTKNDFGTSVLVPKSNLATDPTYWGSLISDCAFKGNSASAGNSTGTLNSKSPASTKSNGAGACQNSLTRS